MFNASDSSTPVLSLGIDSISFTQLRADVAEKYDVDLPMTFLGEDTLSLAELAEYIVDKVKEQSGSGSETETSDVTGSEETLITEAGDISRKDAEKLYIKTHNYDTLQTIDTISIHLNMLCQSW